MRFIFLLFSISLVSVAHAGGLPCAAIHNPAQVEERVSVLIRDGKALAEASERQVARELSASYDQWKSLDALAGTRRAFEAIRKWSGNPYESAVRVKRLALGERFYRLVRAGDVVRAVNYVRRYFGLRAHAEAMLWAQLRIHQFEKDLESPGSLTPGALQSRRIWIQRLKKTVEREAKHLRFYGDLKMIVFQLNRIKIKYDNSIDPKLKNTMIELSQKVQLESVPLEGPIRNMIHEKEIQMSAETGTQPLTKNEIEQYMNERINNVSGRVSQMGYLRSTFPDLFRVDEKIVVGREYKDEIERSINLEADFVGAVYHGHYLRSLGIRGYGQDLPARATALRELGWETVAAVKNVLGVAIKAYGALARSISRNNLEAISELKEDQKDLKLGRWKRSFNSLSLSNRKALKWVLEDLTIYDALNVHASKIDVLENLLQKTHSGFETRKSYVDMLRTFASSENGASALKHKDFFVSFARIQEYTDVFRETMMVVKAEVDAVQQRFPDLKGANSPEREMYDAMVEAWKLVQDGTVSRISLHTEPNMVSHVAKQILTFGTGTYVTTKGVMYAIDPQVWTALKVFLQSAGG